MAEIAGVTAAEVIAVALGVLVLILQSRKADQLEVNELKKRLRELEHRNSELEGDLRILLSSRLCRLILTLRGKRDKIASDFITTGR